MSRRSHLGLAVLAAFGFVCSLAPLIGATSNGWWGTRAGAVTSGVCLGVNGIVFLQSLTIWLSTWPLQQRSTSFLYPLPVGGFALPIHWKPGEGPGTTLAADIAVGESCYVVWWELESHPVPGGYLMEISSSATVVTEPSAIHSVKLTRTMDGFATGWLGVPILAHGPMAPWRRPIRVTRSNSQSEKTS